MDRKLNCVNCGERGLECPFPNVSPERCMVWIDQAEYRFDNYVIDEEVVNKYYEDADQ